MGNWNTSIYGRERGLTLHGVQIKEMEFLNESVKAQVCIYRKVMTP